MSPIKKILTIQFVFLLSIFFCYGQEDFPSLYKYLQANNYEKVIKYSPCDYVIFDKAEKDPLYISFTYGDERNLFGVRAFVMFKFTEIGPEMTNDFISIEFWDENNVRVKYEKANRNMDKGNRTVIWDGNIGRKGCIQYENPILHLWE